MAASMASVIFRPSVDLFDKILPNSEHHRTASSGSFIRALKISPDQLGCSVLTAAKERYDVDATTIQYDKHSFGAKTIELVGMQHTAKKQRYVFSFSFPNCLPFFKRSAAFERDHSGLD